jgi:hypothetical protein
MESYINKSDIANVALEFLIINFKFFKFHHLKNVENCLFFDGIPFYSIFNNILKYNHFLLKTYHIIFLIIIFRY